MLHEWRQIILEEQQCARQIATKEQKELAACSKEEKDYKASAKEDKEHKDNLKVEKEHEDSTKEELHHKASFSDMETDGEASWVEDGVDLRAIHTWKRTIGCRMARTHMAVHMWKVMTLKTR